ncbi:Crp/Fnr family transcriptional regulator [Desulfurobacterium atlanticum]|uniref:Transcriptional regulator, Crp/Fnr family n=1 Tax=Desulfurobacterium atlanticum TaxID=240169 RepID=A0A238YID8_9BACT|nr:Crp/Fnr family transcriptional regulator [Desulfurobacterium atlanticum]SNR70481.1 transcriptional regulator, Crp/Fnr family [Desulfurobacterium atlanticum]
MSIYNILKTIPLFSSLPEKTIREIEYSLIEKHYSKGELIFSSYEKAKGVFILIEGKVKLYKSLSGKEQTLRIFTPVSMLGEAGTFKGENYPANAIALENSTLLLLEKTTLINIIKHNPETALKMLGILSERLFYLVNLVEKLTLKDAVSKVYEYIKENSNSKGEVEFKTSFVAMELGLTVETVSRAVSRLRKSGKIDKKGRKIILK